ncbi:MAG: DapH/DapD/GlmU-related protein [Dehalococcoidales bacterium]|nr:DapH/DapD/GlmU-related protein [Dehalococcoidales bacterium]
MTARYDFAVRQNELYDTDPEVISSHAHVFEGVHFGENCKVKPGAVIGYEGFGFERHPDGTPFRIPHIGKVIIGNNVEIGANTVIARGTVGDTLICDNVKIDDCVFIAHNCRIGRNTLVIAGAVICGSVTIGEGCWIGAGCRIKEKVTIGDGAKIGIGAIVIKDVPAGETRAGMKAQPLESMKKLDRMLALREYSGSLNI